MGGCQFSVEYPTVTDRFVTVCRLGAAMVAYSLLQGNSLAPAARAGLEGQLLRYCELDTLAMVMAFESLMEQAGAEAFA